jgi:hypothetical protein
VTCAEILSAVDRSEKIQGLGEFLSDYTNQLLEEGLIINMLDGEKEVLRWIEQTKN